MCYAFYNIQKGVVTMKILVSGGTTFVSKFTAEYFLKRNNEVYVINRNSRAQLDGVRLINCDRMNLKNLLKINILI